MARYRLTFNTGRAIELLAIGTPQLLETDATPTEVVNWFRSELCQDDILLLWVSGERGHEQVLQDLLQDAPAIDTVLQDKVAFLFTSPTSRATAVRPGGLETAPFFSRINRPDGTYRRNRTATVARATLAAASNFATVLDMHGDEVPGLAILIKHLNYHLVAPMGSSTSLCKIRPWLTEIVASTRRHHTRCNASTVEDLLKAGISMQEIGDAHRTITAQRNRIRETLSGLRIRHPEIENSGAAILELVTKEAEFDPTMARQALDSLLREAKRVNAHRLLSDGRLEKLGRLLQKIEEDENALRALLAMRQSIQTEHDHYRESLTQLERDICGSCHMLVGSRMASVRAAAGSFFSATPRLLDRTTRLLDALGKLSENLPRLS